MEGAPRSCEDKHFVLYKSHFLWTHEAYQHHKEPQWGSEIQANTAAPRPRYLPLLSPHALSLCMQLQHYVCSCVSTRVSLSLPFAFGGAYIAQGL